MNVNRSTLPENTTPTINKALTKIMKYKVIDILIITFRLICFIRKNGEVNKLRTYKWLKHKINIEKYFTVTTNRRTQFCLSILCSIMSTIVNHCIYHRQ